MAFAAEEDATRFESLQDRVEALFATAVVEPADATPVALAGFTFDAEAWRDGTWDGFPDGLVFVPRLLCATRDGVHALTLSHLVASDDDVASIAGALSDDAGRWLPPMRLKTVRPPDGARRAVNEVHEEWDDSVRDLVERIGRGEAEKVVLARRVAAAARPRVRRRGRARPTAREVPRLHAVRGASRRGGVPRRHARDAGVADRA